MMRTAQQGYVLLVITALMLSAGVGLLTAGAGKTVQERRAEQDRNVLKQLRNIKQRLLTYAATYPETHGDDSRGPGYFPCPTLDSDGVSQGSNGCQTGDVSIGWLPRKISTRNISFQAEGLNWENVWFVVDNHLVVKSGGRCVDNTPRVESYCEPLNTTQTASLDKITLNDKDGYVALLIYAGNAALDGQNPDRNNPDASDYLDDENGDGDTDFITRPGIDDVIVFNDVVVPITKKEWDRVIKNRVLRSASDGNWCAGGTVPTWFTTNNWDQSDAGICQ